MFIFREDKVFYRRVGLMLMLVQFWIFIFTMPPFQFGIWIQTEPVMVALFFMGALNCLWLAYGLIKKLLAAQVPHPVLLCLFLWIGWQLLATAGASNSWRSWFGPGEDGAGAGAQVMMLLQFMVIYPLWQNLSSRRVVIEGAISGLLAQSLLHWLFPSGADSHYVPGSWAPAEWAAYLAFMAAPLWIALVASRSVKSVRSYGVIIFLFVIILAISHNKSAMVLFPAAMLCSLFVLTDKSERLRRFFYPGRRWRALAITACVLLPLAWVAFSAYYPAFPDSGPKILSEKDGPISSRIVFNKVGIATMQHEPSRWIMGDGWGRFTDDLFKYVLVDGVKVFQDGQHSPNWFMVDGQAFNSHNQQLEALLSLGLPGMILWFALPIVAIIFLPKRLFWGCAPMIVAQTVLCSLWFELAQCIPYQALGWVVLGSVAGNKINIKSAWPVPLLIVMGAVMAWSTCQQWDVMMYGDKLHDLLESKDYKNYNLEWVEKDIWRGGDRLRASALGFTSFLSGKDKIDDGDRELLAVYLQAAHDASLSPHVGPRVASADVQLKYDLLIDLPFPSLAEMGHNAALSLPDSLMRLYARAPLRDDISSTYVVNLPDLTHNDANHQIDILKQMLASMPNNRGVLWALGNLLYKTPGHEKDGENMRASAMKLGVGRVYPITQKDSALVK